MSDARLYWDKTRERWTVRWTDSVGQRRVKCTWRKNEQAAAEEFRRSLLDPPPAQAPQVPHPEPPKGSEPGTADWYARALQVLTAKVLRDPANRDAQSALRAVSQAATASAPLRDYRELEETYARLRARYDELTKAQKHGASVRAAPKSTGTGGAVVRRDDAVR